MSYASFHEYFPKMAEEETRCLMMLNDPELPVDNYALVEMYCDEPGCDCRRVFLAVMSEKTGKMLAVIAYGWESKKFYAQWMGDNDPKTIRELKGPALNLMSPQSKLSPILLDRVESIVLKDKNYIQRLKRHYGLFREAVEKKERRNRRSIHTNKDILESSKKTGRNAPCPCGSGKKFKKCCIK